MQVPRLLLDSGFVLRTPRNDEKLTLRLARIYGAERAVAFNAWGTPLRFNAPWWFWNLFGEQAVFLLSRRG